jgi:hypothetical protein
MNESLVQQLRYTGTMKRTLKLSIPVVMLGLGLLEPASPMLFRLQLVRPLLPLLGGASCIGALRIVLPLLLAPDSD